MFLKASPFCLAITGCLFAEDDDRTNAEVLKDTISDVIEVVAATAGAVASCEIGNPALRAALSVAAALGMDRAIDDGRELWDRMMNDNDSNHEGCAGYDHDGGNDEHDGSNI